MKVRNAEKRDIPEIILLLHQVLEVHAELRPDLFISGTTKYNADTLEKILKNPQTPVFVCVNEEDKVKGYAFCIFEQIPKSENLHQVKTLYINSLRLLSVTHIFCVLYENYCLTWTPSL